jgi:hypothetical protein
MRWYLERSDQDREGGGKETESIRPTEALLLSCIAVMSCYRMRAQAGPVLLLYPVNDASSGDGVRIGERNRMTCGVGFACVVSWKFEESGGHTRQLSFSPPPTPPPVCGNSCKTVELGTYTGNFCITLCLVESWSFYKRTTQNDHTSRTRHSNAEVRNAWIYTSTQSIYMQ